MSDADTPPTPELTLNLPEGTQELAGQIIPNRETAKAEMRKSILNGVFAAMGATIGALLPRAIRHDFARTIGLSAERAAQAGVSGIHETFHVSLSEAVARNNPFDRGMAGTIKQIRKEVAASDIGLGKQFGTLSTFGKVTTVSVGAIVTGMAVYHAAAAVKSWRSHLRHKNEADHAETVLKDRVRQALNAGELTK